MILKDEFGKTAIFQWRGAKGALADEAVGAVRDRHRRPVPNRLLRGHVTARVEGISRWLTVHPK